VAAFEAASLLTTATIPPLAPPLLLPSAELGCARVVEHIEAFEAKQLR